jgi:hypothetical protein
VHGRHCFDETIGLKIKLKANLNGIFESTSGDVTALAD